MKSFRFRNGSLSLMRQCENVTKMERVKQGKFDMKLCDSLFLFKCIKSRFFTRHSYHHFSFHCNPNIYYMLSLQHRKSARTTAT